MSDLFNEAMQSILDQDPDKAREVVKKAVDSGVNLTDLMNKGFIVGINKVGELFSMGRLFLPELMLSADAMSSAVEKVKENLPVGSEPEKTIVMTAATVKGDLHDIGKGIGVAMYRANGWIVHDLGRDVEVEDMINTAIKTNSVVIGTSALLTTTLPEQKKLEEALKSAGLKDKIITMVAGAPVTQRWANRIGASVYAEDSHDAVVKITAALNA